MKDRNVQYPNRYQLVKVEGTDDIYDLTPAPGTIVEEGTIINKSALLKDETAELFGLGNDAVPDDVFRKALIPPGIIFWFAAIEAPDGFLICDGSLISRSDYDRLFSAIGTTFGSGDGSTTFALPDLRAKFIRGAGTNSPYSANFGQTQAATGIAAGLSTLVSPTLVSSSDGSMGTLKLGGDSAYSSYSFTYQAVRPFNIALTPIIKY